MTKRALTVLAVLCMSAAIFAAPTASTIWGTVSRTQALDGLVELMATSNADTAPGLAMALRRQAERAAGHIAALDATDVTTLTPEESAELVAALHGFYDSMRNANAVLLGKGYTEEAGLFAAASHQLATSATVLRLGVPNDFEEEEGDDAQ